MNVWIVMSPERHGDEIVAVAETEAAAVAIAQRLEISSQHIVRHEVVGSDAPVQPPNGKGWVCMINYATGAIDHWGLKDNVKDYIPPIQYKAFANIFAGSTVSAEHAEQEAIKALERARHRSGERVA